MRHRSPRHRWPVLVVSVALVGLALPTMAAVAADARIVVAGSSPIPANVTVVNEAITTAFDVTLAPRSPSALASYIASLSNTASPNYRHFLTTREFARRFGATASSVDAVRTYFRGYGLSVGSLSKGHLVLHLKGTTPQIARAFAASVETVRRSSGVLAAQLASPGSVPAPVARDIAGVAGLSSVVQPSTDLVRSHTSSHVALPTTCPNDGGELSTTPNANGGYTPFQLASLYGFNTKWANNITGAGQTIAVYELSAYDPGDLATYLNCYGLNPTITPVSVDGGPTGPFDDEPTLDIEELTAMAPGANILSLPGTEQQQRADRRVPADRRRQHRHDRVHVVGDVRERSQWRSRGRTADLRTDGGPGTDRALRGRRLRFLGLQRHHEQPSGRRRPRVPALRDGRRRSQREQHQSPQSDRVEQPGEVRQPRRGRRRRLDAVVAPVVAERAGSASECDDAIGAGPLDHWPTPAPDSSSTSRARVRGCVNRTVRPAGIRSVVRRSVRRW